MFSASSHYPHTQAREHKGASNHEQELQSLFHRQEPGRTAGIESPAVGGDQLLVKPEISQINTGTELTYLERNIGEGSTWEKDIVFENTSHLGLIEQKLHCLRKKGNKSA